MNLTWEGLRRRGYAIEFKQHDGWRRAVTRGSLVAAKKIGHPIRLAKGQV